MSRQKLLQLRDKALEDVEDIIDTMKRAVAFPDPEYRMTPSQQEAAKLYWPTIDRLIMSVQDDNKVQATNVKEIINLLKEGSISTSDALEFIKVLKLGAEAEAIAKGGTGMPVPKLEVTLTSPAEEVKESDRS